MVAVHVGKLGLKAALIKRSSSGQGPRCSAGLVSSFASVPSVVWSSSVKNMRALEFAAVWILVLVRLRPCFSFSFLHTSVLLRRRTGLPWAAFPFIHVWELVSDLTPSLFQEIEPHCQFGKCRSCCCCVSLFVFLSTQLLVFERYLVIM